MVAFGEAEQGASEWPPLRAAPLGEKARNGSVLAGAGWLRLLREIHAEVQTSAPAGASVARSSRRGRPRARADDVLLAGRAEATLTILPCGRFGNRLFQLAALVAAGLRAGGQLAVLLPRIPLAAELRDVASGVARAGRHEATLFRRLGPLLASADLLEFDWPADQRLDEGLRGRCRECTLYNHAEGREQGLTYGVSSCYASFDTAKCVGARSLRSSALSGEDWAAGLADAALEAARTSNCRVVRLAGQFHDLRFFAPALPELRRLLFAPDFRARASELQNASRQLRQLLPRSTLPASSDESDVGGDFVAVHVRLGDYLSTPGYLMHPDYYRAAVARAFAALGKAENRGCLIFSDLPGMVASYFGKTQLCGRQRIVPKLVDDVSSFYMMALSPALVLADSTFSFWAALLGPPRIITVAPDIDDRRFRYLTQPPDWVRIPARLMF